MDSLKKMKESLGSFQIAECGEQSFVAEYSHMQKYVNEYNVQTSGNQTCGNRSVSHITPPYASEHLLTL